MTCFEHTQQPGKQVYGNTKRNGVSRGMHVWALIDKTGEQPEGRHALHTCDNKRCINPDHLYWGTPQQNMDDKVSRGRWKGGGPRHLTAEQVRYVREAFAAGASKASIGRHLNKSPGVIFQILTGQTYKELG